MIYDQNRNAPLLRDSRNLSIRLPAEALLAAIEVKSVLTLGELRKAYKSASKIRGLRPFRRLSFLLEEEGAPADDRNWRCLFSVFAYETNISKNPWINSEWARLLL